MAAFLEAQGNCYRLFGAFWSFFPGDLKSGRLAFYGLVPSRRFHLQLNMPEHVVEISERTTEQLFPVRPFSAVAAQLTSRLLCSSFFYFPDQDKKWFIDMK